MMRSLGTSPRIRPHVSVAAVALLFALSAPGVLFGQPEGSRPEPRKGDTVEEYVVEPGDTLRGLTKRFLGVESLWRENYRLNPQIRSPNFLKPGENLRIITHRELEGLAAEITQLARRVEEKPHPGAWKPAKRGDRLHEDDGIRTFRASSAELDFDDGGRLVLTETSLVYLRRLDKSLTGVRQETIEIVDGQADFAARRTAGIKTDIEIIIGGAKSRPKVDSGGRADSRARMADGGKAQVMVYAGSSAVEAGGAKVQVPRGMGTSVPEGGAPSPPEKLLPKARLGEPAAGAVYSYANPSFSWSPVKGAAAYTFEVCGDAACTQLVSRAVGLTETGRGGESLPAGDLFWRVTAVSASGLDGYPADATAFQIATDRPDLEPPVVAALIEGAGRAKDGGGVLLAAGSRLRLAPHDDVSGLKTLSYSWNGESWTTWKGETLAPPSRESGDFVLHIRSIDRVGRESPEQQIRVSLDTAPPPAPTAGEG